MPGRSRPGLPTTALPTASIQGGGDKCATGPTTTTSSIRLPKENTVIGTWNVRTLYACGKIIELTHELSRYTWDILGLAEVRWTGIGETITDEGHKLWFSGDDCKQHRIGFIVNNSVISCTPPAGSSLYLFTHGHRTSPSYRSMRRHQSTTMKQLKNFMRNWSKPPRTLQRKTSLSFLETGTPK